MVEIRNKYEKAIILIQQMVRYSYRISLKEKVNREKLEDLTNDIEMFMPHFQQYRDNIELRRKLVKFEEPPESQENLKYRH